jgi:integrase
VRWRAGDWVDPKAGRITVSEWVKEWLAHYTSDLRDSTRVRAEGILLTHVEPRFGQLALARLDHASLQEWVTELTAKGLGPASVAKVTQGFSKVLSDAVDARKIPSNPATRLRLPKVVRSEQRFLTPEQVGLLAQCLGERYAAVALLGAYGGLRAGELFGLRWKNVELLKRQVDVREIVVEIRGRLQTGPPKTKAAVRTVPIPSIVCDELAKLAEPGQDPEAHVFTAPMGGPVRLNAWRRRFWVPACVEAGLGQMVRADGSKATYEGLRIHDLRHTAVAFWIHAGASPLDVKRRAGHTSVVTVLDHYGHILPAADDPVNEALNRMAAASTGSIPNSRIPHQRA